jgi:hypothetical protein
MFSMRYFSVIIMRAKRVEKSQMEGKQVIQKDRMHHKRIMRFIQFRLKVRMPQLAENGYFSVSS